MFTVLFLVFNMYGPILNILMFPILEHFAIGGVDQPLALVDM